MGSWILGLRLGPDRHNHIREDALSRVEKIGDATLYLGDCREILPHLNMVDSIITDPPYGIALKPQRCLTEAILGDGIVEARALWEAFVPLCKALCRPNTGHLFWTGWSETWTKEVLETQFRVKSCVVWGKNMWGIGYYTRPQHEMAWYCHSGRPDPLEVPDSDLWLVPKVQAPEHSCEKPVALMERAIRLCSRSSGDLVLDPFMGSGATGCAAIRMNRKFVGIELDPSHFDLAFRRIEEAYRQPRLFQEEIPQPKQEAFDL